MQPKIIPRIFGGLGNQLFIYAASRRMALVNNAELVLDDVSGFARDDVYQRHYQLNHFNIPCRKATAEERLEPASRIRRYIKRRTNQWRPFMERRYIQQEGIDFDPRLLTVKPCGTIYLEGYWQSEGYFKDVGDIIREDLRIIPPSDIHNQEMARRICESRAVALHVRFFDTPTKDSPNNAPSDYYARAIVLMDTLVPDAHYFLFSDQPDAARSHIPLSDDRVTCVTHNGHNDGAYADLWLMMQCRHFIIANSTFSWWGAWLCGNPAKQVVAPALINTQGTRVTSWGFKGLLPTEWIKL